MLTDIKHVADDNFIFLQDCTVAHHACYAVQLLENEILNFTFFQGPFPNSPEVNPLIKRISHALA